MSCAGGLAPSRSRFDPITIHYHRSAGKDLGVAMIDRSPIFVAAVAFIAVSSACAEGPVRLQETFEAGTVYRVRSRMKGTATLTIPPEKDKKEAQSLTKTAESDIDYDERILEMDSDRLPNKTLRIYRAIEFRKEIEKQKDQNTLRPVVRRLVLLRDKSLKMPFSPDGPLMGSEIELVRTDVFTPLLRGLLSPDAVKPGDTWKASTDSVRELTDMQIEEGALECKFQGVVKVAGRSVADIGISGSVRGVSEDGPVRHEISGRFYFDLDSQHISYISFQGRQLFLDKDGKATGKIEGVFTMTRQARIRAPDLTDESIKGLKLEPDDDNTLLLYDNEDLGVRFTHSRRWKVTGVQGRQIMIDAEDKNGILLTLDALSKIPSADQFIKESESFIRQQKGRIMGTTNSRRIQDAPREIDQFAIDAVMIDKRVLLDYFILRQKVGGATLVATLAPDNIRATRPEVERIAKSLVVTK